VLSGPKQMSQLLRITGCVPSLHSPRKSTRCSFCFSISLLTYLVAWIARSSSGHMGTSSPVTSYSASTQTALELGFSVDSFLQSSILSGSRVWICGWSPCSHGPFSRKDRAVAHVARVHIGAKMYSCRNACGNPKWYVAQCLPSRIARL
jgi:hypothetical protein